jgi:predicted secreted protein
VEQIELRKGERSIVKLKGLGSAGYRWESTVDDPRLVYVERLVAERDSQQPAPGSWSQDEQFCLIGANVGETVVRFSQRRPFDRSKPPMATREIAVRVT